MKSAFEIDYIYEKLASKYHYYSNKKPKSKIYSKAYTSLIGVMLSAQSQDKRTAIACNQLFRLASTPQDMIKLSREEQIIAFAIGILGLLHTNWNTFKKLFYLGRGEIKDVYNYVVNI